MWGVRVSIRPEQPEPFLRGCVFPAVTDAPYPRADPAGAEYLPADVWDAAQLPVGVRLEMLGNARTIRIWYRTRRASLGYRGESAGCSFVAYRGGQRVAVADAVMGEGMAEMVLSGRPELPVTVYIPEGMQPLITGVAGVEDTMDPAPLQPRWLAYGDAVTQGWLASAPAMAWPAVAGRKLGLDVCNLGYAGTARGETTSALLLADTPAEVVSIAFGLNNWSRVPHTTGLMAEEVRCFLSVVRKGHPDVPIVVVSPTARPDAEDVPNRVGATLAQLRRAMEETVLDCMADGDTSLFLVEGLSVVDPEHLEDGMYPGDEGHRRLAAAVSKILVPHLADLQTAAEKRRATDAVVPDPFSAPSVFDTPATTSVFDTPVTASVFDTPVTASVFETPVFETPVFESDIFEPETFETPSANGAIDLDALASTSDFATWDGAVLDETALDFGALEGELTDVASRNFDLEDLDSLDRSALDDALQDALSPNGSSSHASPTPAADGPLPTDPGPLNAAPGDTEHEGTVASDEAMTEAGPDTVPMDTAPIDTVPMDTAPSETTPIDTVPMDTAPSETTPMDTAPIDTAPSEPAPMDTGSVHAAPVDPPLGSAPGDAAAVEDVPGSVLVDAVPQEAAPVQPVPVGDTNPSNGSNGHSPNGSSPLTTGGAAARATSEGRPVRRDIAPVDIAVADMVVAALSIATNGASDVTFVQNSGPTDGRQWAQAVDPTSY